MFLSSRGRQLEILRGKGIEFFSAQFFFFSLNPYQVFSGMQALLQLNNCLKFSYFWLICNQSSFFWRGRGGGGIVIPPVAMFDILRQQLLK